MVMKVRYGYRKLTKDEAESGQFGTRGLRITKIITATPILLQMRIMVLKSVSYEAIAEWLNDEGIPVGPYATNGMWTGALVQGLLQDPILSGQRRFRKGVTRITYRTGKTKTKANPNAPEMQEYPELAHFTLEEHRELLAA